VASRQPGEVKIVNHPDVRRMLLWMKAAVDGMRSMIYTGAFWADLGLELPEGEEKTHYENLTDLMTPIIKAYCSDVGFRVCETAIQCLGGYGYCKDYPLEQYLRDAKIMSLYEGTNGIQSMDLMGRKMSLRGGACLESFKMEIARFCDQQAEHLELGTHVRALSNAVRRLLAVCAEMKQRNQADPLQWASYTYPALMAFGEVIMCWRLLDMAVIAVEALKKKQSDFHLGKVRQATFFVDITLPHTLASLETCLRFGREVVEMPEAAF